MSPMFVKIQRLKTLVLSVTEKYCPMSLPLLRVESRFPDSHSSSAACEDTISAFDSLALEPSPPTEERAEGSEILTPSLTPTTTEGVTKQHRRRQSSISNAKCDAGSNLGLGLGLGAHTSLLGTDALVQIDIEAANDNIPLHDATLPPIREIRK